mmetsp:Transcript_18170/g.49107  ORF Transcript_18170/g.49107 Transcript_18170/m.49107 type:complete len:249 (-) Transcript_18170:119-865(-)
MSFTCSRVKSGSPVAGSTRLRRADDMSAAADMPAPSAAKADELVPEPSIGGGCARVRLSEGDSRRPQRWGEQLICSACICIAPGESTISWKDCSSRPFRSLGLTSSIAPSCGREMSSLPSWPKSSRLRPWTTWAKSTTAPPASSFSWKSESRNMRISSRSACDPHSPSIPRALRSETKFSFASSRSSRPFSHSLASSVARASAYHCVCATWVIMRPEQRARTSWTEGVGEPRRRRSSCWKSAEKEAAM